MRFNQILILDTIPAGERNTALRLRDDLLIRSDIFGPTPEVLYHRVENRVDALGYLSQVADRITAPGDIPVLHFECHGGEDGVRFADGSDCSWTDLKPSLVQLNVASAMNLLVVMASCDGHQLTQTVQLTDTAPLFALIGATCRLLPEEIEHCYLEFYSTLFETRSASQTFAALRATRPDTYVYRSAEMIFEFVWDHQQRTAESPEGRLLRAEELFRQRGAELPGHITPEDIAQLYRDKNRYFFDTFRRDFFMIDRFPEHVERFPIAYRPPEDYEAEAAHE